MKLDEKSIRWSLNHLIKYGDTDLFPKPVELDCLYEIENEAVNKIKEIDLGNYEYGASRRFIVPKDELSYRTATQLDPLDNIILTAVIYEYGNLIENRRIPISEDKIFGYRFQPQGDWSLYNPNVSWLEFWKNCKKKSSNYKYAVYLDIADFYNQIYHHNIENQLIQSCFPNQIKKWIMNLLESITVKVSRGIPVGPHSTHILGEMSLISVDNSLSMKGIDYCRYVDDIVIFCDDYTQGRVIVYQMAEILDKQQRLIVQKQKTKIYESEEFEAHCQNMLQDRPINDFEEEILTVLRARSSQNPYSPISLNALSLDEVKVFDKNRIETILSDYLKEREPNFTRLRWLLRRLSQVGVPSAVDFCINHADELTPAISDICHYLVSVNNNYTGDWKNLGTKIFNLLNSDLIKSNEYFQMTLLSLFARKRLLNNSSSLISTYQSSPPTLRREILLSAYALNMGDWLRELKESYQGLDTWSKRAFIIATKSLPVEERRFFLDHIKDGSVLNDLLIKWSKT
ncbi:reverse transcriptase domain-containing protein [Microcoleus sp. N9_B4]|uniref:reverse transcriptase domain-containing protein n=1 Tax=Microcoleus sp. N9_B4 TaxID=3055386 RepID=UPI002FD48950